MTYGPYTLVVIDMQPRFEAATYRKTLRGVKDAIMRAKQLSCPIIVLEYGTDYDYEDEEQLTHWYIQKALSNYGPVVYREKNTDSGGDEIAQEIQCHGFPTDIRVCGVNGSACVRATVQTYLKQNQDVSVAIIVKAVANPKTWYGSKNPLYWVDHENDSRLQLV